ncbi:MAG: hypothetical protein DI538_12995 [Azospira oryzae]|nr:MAG: hypothetical protein DI538_12995 [Azospira oryzae]
MKNRILFFGICFFSMHFASAQNSGIYMNGSDFSQGKLTYSIKRSEEKHKIKLNEFLNKDYITVIHDKKPHNLKKKEIFGYKDCNNTAYRFVGDSHYVILNPTEKILLYKHELPASKNQKIATHYFFTDGVGDEIKELTRMNLKKEFPESHKFHDALDAEFKSDDELVLFDSFNNEYKINRLYTTNR